jgi:chromosome segregation ATPase
MHRTIDREAAVAEREKAVVRQEKVVIKRDLEVEEWAKAARDVINHTMAAAKMIDEERANLQQQELAVAEERARLASLRVDLANWAQDLREREVALQEKEAKVEEFLAEWSAGIERVVKSVGEANSSLDTLGLSPIQITEAPSSLGAILPALDSAVERLQLMESTVLERLETEGQAVARAMVEYVLTCFRSQDPAVPLTPVLVGPVLETVAAAWEGVQEAVGIVVSRIERLADPDLLTEGDPFGPPTE